MTTKTYEWIQAGYFLKLIDVFQKMSRPLAESIICTYIEKYNEHDLAAAEEMAATILKAIQGKKEDAEHGAKDNPTDS